MSNSLLLFLASVAVTGIGSTIAAVWALRRASDKVVLAWCAYWELEGRLRQIEKNLAGPPAEGPHRTRPTVRVVRGDEGPDLRSFYDRDM